VPKRLERALWVVLRQEDRATCMSGRGVEQRRVNGLRDLRQLVCRAERGIDVVGRQHDLDVRRQEPGPPRWTVCLVQSPANRCVGGADVVLGEPQQREPGLRLSSKPAGLPVSLFGPAELAAQAMDLGVLIECGPCRRLGGFAKEALACALRGSLRVLPRAVHLENLGAANQALTAVRHQVGLRLAPVAQRCRPLLGPAEIEDLEAPLDHAAVHITRDER
jgi:hypothetical protein